MALVLNDDGLTSIKLRYVERKKDGSYQYRRRIPQALQHKYAGRSFFVKSLKRDGSTLVQNAYDLTNQLNLLWSKMQGISDCKILSSDLVINPGSRNSECSKPVVKTSFDQDSLTLSEAAALYMRHHKYGEKKSFREDCDRVISSAVQKLGDLPIGKYCRSDAEKLRDHWIKQGATRTTRRRLITVVAIINKARKEKQLQILNPFEGLSIIGEGDDGTKRIPFTAAELKIVSTHYRNLDDDIRHIIAFQADTGCRVAEIVGLRVEDVVLNHPVPHVRIRPWGKVRTLKTTASERDIPLVGDALWAARRELEARQTTKDSDPWLFPRYASDKEIKATHASNTLNKWLRSLTGVSDQKTTHCFRHSMRDRLRAAQVPVEIQDVIGGWGTRTIGQGYGNGYPLDVLAEHLLRAVIAHVTPRNIR